MCIVCEAVKKRDDRMQAMNPEHKGIGAVVSEDSNDDILALYFSGTEFNDHERFMLNELATFMSRSALLGIARGEASTNVILESMHLDGVAIGLQLAKSLIADGREVA